MITKNKLPHRIQLTRNFFLDEFTCKDGKGSFVHRRGDKFMKAVLMLQMTRSRIKAGLKISSAYRTWEHHYNIYKRQRRKVTTKSKHLENYAFDVTYWSRELRTRKNILALKDTLIASGFTGIGINLKKMFIHCDLGPKRSWTY